MPQLNLEVGLPTVQLVGLETTKEELLEIYFEVYKLHRLPRSPPGVPAILKEVMVSLPDSPRCKEEKTQVATVQPHPGSSHFSRGGAPHGRRNNNSMERSLATVHKEHQRVLAAVTTLEEEIERLSQTRNHSKSRARSKSRTTKDQVEKGKRRGAAKSSLKSNLPPATLPTPEHNQVRGPRAEALTWRNHQN